MYYALAKSICRCPTPLRKRKGIHSSAYTLGKYGVLSTSSRPTLHMRSVVLATCETESALGEYVKA